MIDFELLRKNQQDVKKHIYKKDPAYDFDLLCDLDKEVRRLKSDLEELRKQKNDLAKAGQQGVTAQLREQSVALGKHIKIKEAELEAIETRFQEHALSCPNIPFEDVPVGGKEKNQVVKMIGSKKEFSFPVKNHVELATQLGWIDFEVGARISGAGFPFYQGDGVRLLYSLTMFMLKNNIKHGFEPMLPSALVNERSLEVSGNFPKFKEQVYGVPGDALFLTPTSEVNLANRYREHIFNKQDLPVRMTAWTNCFRREAGSYGATERGLIRIHQFDKVELVTICQPEHSPAELDRMVACAEDILKQLDLHYRISLLAAEDCSFQSAKTFDIEVWLPGQKEYYEVSSASNCTDFQARRGLIRYREKEGEKTKLVHTLNASSLALPRLIVAIMETYQQADGSIVIPDVLKREGLFG